MKIVSSGLLMISAAGLTLGLVHLRFWLSQRERRDQLAFSLACISLSLFAWFELGLMHAGTPEEYGSILKMAHVGAAAVIVSSAWFMKENLGGRPTLFWLIVGFRGAGVVLNFLSYPNVNFREISALGRASIFGETLSYPIGTPNPWAIIPQIGLILLIIYALDSCLRVWLRGDRRKAVTFGACSLVCALWIVIAGFGVQWGLLSVPLLISPSLLILAAPMLYELNHEMQHSVKLTGKLRQRERELGEALNWMNLSAATGNLGIWSRKAGQEELLLSDKAREIFDIPVTTRATFSEFVSRVHPEDRERLTRTIRKVENEGGEYHIQYRLLLHGTELKWIDSRGKVVAQNGNPRTLYGASLDITGRKNAENAIHLLSGKLMDAQEKERARLARELHDDLSQRLALLSVRLEALKGTPVYGEGKREIDHLIADIQDLTTDVHRISHELHPAKLRQLGLEAALRGFCREIARAHALKVSFSATNVPRELPNHVSLCLYRVAQESLQNVVKHSRARSADVELFAEGDELILVISDDGLGFDPLGRSVHESLGLTSMQERVIATNGTVAIISSKETGTRIEARVPVGSVRAKAVPSTQT